jgi:hypothetical protein
VPLITPSSSSSSSTDAKANEVEFVRLSVHGQSFLLNMIRKMIGNVLGYMHGLYGEDFMQVQAFSEKRRRVPVAPALGMCSVMYCVYVCMYYIYMYLDAHIYTGLLLDHPVYKHYDQATEKGQLGQATALFSDVYKDNR